MIENLVFTIVLFSCMFISSLIFVFFIQIDDDEVRYYKEKGLKIPFEWLRKSGDGDNLGYYLELLICFGVLIPYIFALVISLVFFDRVMGDYIKLKQIILVIIYFPIYKITVKLYNYLKKRGKLKYRKFKFENETNNSESKES